MPIVDEQALLTTSEVKKFHTLLENYKFIPDNFIIEVTEDQDDMDINDLSYLVILNISATHMGSKISKIYRSRAKSGNWLDDFENDLKIGAFDI